MKEVNVVWLKRDLRLSDHKPLRLAVENGKPFIILYAFEPLYYCHSDFDIRHAQFIWQSLTDLKKEVPITIAHSDIIHIFDLLQSEFLIHNIYSYQETGLEHTYKRDLEFQEYCQCNGLNWIECQQNGVI